MQPRSGIRGVTVDDVANVAQNGSSVMRGGYTFTRGRRAPSLSATNVQDILAGMTATPLNTAGLKYSGFPTASAREAAVLGSIQPFYDIGDYARQLAEQQMVPLVERQARVGADIRSQAEQQLADAQARLDAVKAGRVFLGTPPEAAGIGAPGTSATVPVGPSGFRPAPSEASDELLAKAEADRDLAAYGAAMAARNQYAFAQPTYRQNEITGEWTTEPSTYAEGLQDTILTGARNQPEYQQRIAPLEQMASDIQAIPRYQLAQQMATQYFGMDPAEAAGTFTPQIDIDYMDMMTDYQTAQNLARGIDPNASTEDILLSLDPSGQRLMDYQQMIAMEAENKLMEGARNAEEEAYDLNVEVSTGYNVKQAAGDDFALSTARAKLSDPAFVAQIDQGIADMQEASAVLTMSAEDRKGVADRIAAQYMTEYADPVGARILLNILYGYTFTIPTS
jgi:hypothetical protein